MKTRKLGKRLLAGLAMTALLYASGAAADSQRHRAKASLNGYQETPQTLSTPATGSFRAKIDDRDQTIDYRLSYEGLESAAAAAHIHLGARATTGGVSAFLCGGGGKPACPATSGTVEGTITPSDVIGPVGQGIAPGEFAEVVRAIRAGAVYANVHTAGRPSGEIRGQLRTDEDDD